MRQWFGVLAKLLRRRQGRQALNEMLVSFQAAQEAMDAGELDRSLERLDDEQAEALLAEVLLDLDQDGEP